MKNLFRAALVLILPLAVSCGHSEQLEINNNSAQGFYVMNRETADKITDADIDELLEEGDVIHLDANGGGYSTHTTGYNTKESEFSIYEQDDKLVFCFVTDAALEKAKKNRSKVEYQTVSTDTIIKNLNGITINIKDGKGKSDFELTMVSKMEL